MFYKTDFSHHFYNPNKSGKAVKRWASEIAKRQPIIPTIAGGNFQIQNKLDKLNNTKPLVKPWKKDKKKQRPLKKSLSKIFHRFCENTTIHGVRYLGMKNQHWSERIIWILLVAAGFAGIAFICYLLQQRFSGTPLATVVESTIFPVSMIPYPAVTICNFYRIDWNKVESARQKYIPNASNQTVEHFYSFLKVLSTLEYGSFDEFVGIQDWNLTELESINLLELYQDVSYNCTELFDGATCWWRNRYLNCCDLFFPAISEYGLCFAFNSAMNEVGRRKVITESDYPWRTATHADWSALRLIMYTPNQTIPDSTGKHGIVLMVSNPFEWPSFGYIIPSGSSTSVMIRPTYAYATDNVAVLEILQRNCLFDGERNVPNLEVMQLPIPSKKYTTAACYTECRQRHMIKYCNCTMAFFYPTGNYPVCNISAVKCLNLIDPIMNYQKPPPGNQYFNDSEEGISCTCLQECVRTEYSLEISPNMISDTAASQIILDVHFQKQTLVKYRTDVVFGWMDLLVGFGGIAGLFLGASIMSGMEFIYYCLIGAGFIVHKIQSLIVGSGEKDSETVVEPVQEKKNKNKEMKSFN